MLKKLSKKISSLPESNGVYLFKDEERKIIYIGKAKNLQKRVASYFSPYKDNRYIIPFLVDRVRDIFYQTTLNEKEALLLEESLIKKWKPKYNTELKDDKSYAYIELQKGLGYPKLVIKSTLPVLIDFWAPWCNPCRAIAPVVEELAKTYKGKVNFVKMNVDDNSDTPSKYGISSIPTLMLFNKGEVVDRVIGAVSRESLDKFVKKAL